MKLFAKSLGRFSAFSIATGFGTGLAPFAPGTFGSLVAFPFLFFMNGSSPLVVAAFWISIFLIGLWATRVVILEKKNPDPSFVVIDEVIGQALSLGFVMGENWKWNVAGFCLFRFFDILKIPPVRFVDRWSKKHTGWLGAFGIIADDLLAGCQAFVCLMLLKSFGFLS